MAASSHRSNIGYLHETKIYLNISHPYIINDR